LRPLSFGRNEVDSREVFDDTILDNVTTAISHAGARVVGRTTANPLATCPFLSDNCDIVAALSDRRVTKSDDKRNRLAGNDLRNAEGG